jgi:plasmid stabilization system protein ParE
MELQPGTRLPQELLAQWTQRTTAHSAADALPEGVVSAPLGGSNLRQQHLVRRGGVAQHDAVVAQLRQQLQQLQEPLHREVEPELHQNRYRTRASGEEVLGNPVEPVEKGFPARIVRDVRAAFVELEEIYAGIAVRMQPLQQQAESFVLG